MKTKLEQITTAAELITYTLAFGVPTDPESICRMQDIIGHSTQDELIALAKKYKETVQNLQDENRALLDQVAYQEKEIKKLRTWNDNDTARINNDTDRIKELNDQLKEAAKAATDNQSAVGNLRETINAKDQEIMELKAKLYDLITKQ